MFEPYCFVAVTCYPTYLQKYMTLFFLVAEWVGKMKPNLNSIEGHSQLSPMDHLVDWVLVGAGSHVG
jgi:hypothetical protein